MKARSGIEIIIRELHKLIGGRNSGIFVNVSHVIIISIPPVRLGNAC